MREPLDPVDAVIVDTLLGQIHVRPLSAESVQVEAPHLTVDGAPLRAWAFLVGSRETRRYDLLMESREGTFVTAPNALGAQLVDGRAAGVVTLGKIAEVIIPAVNQLASERWAVFLEAERRSLNNDIRGREEQRDHLQTRIEEKEREYTAVEAELHKLIK